MKGLKILLEQQYNTVESAESEGWSLDRPDDYSSDTHDMISVEGFNMYRIKEVEETEEQPEVQDDTQVDNQVDTPPVQTSRKSEIEQRIIELIVDMEVMDMDEKDLTSKLSDEDKKDLARKIVSLYDRKLNGDFDNLKMEDLDETVANFLVKTLIEKGGRPYYIQYTPEMGYDIKTQLRESVGLEKILYEQVLTGDKQRVYIEYGDNNSISFTSGDKAQENSTRTWNMKYGQEVKPEEPAQSPEPQQSEEPEKRPEEEMGIQNNKLLNDIYKRAGNEGIDAVRDLIQKNFTDRQKRIIKSMNGEGYVLLRPINPNMYEVVDVKAKYGDDFKDFDEFKMYKVKTSGVDVKGRAKSISELAKLQKITKPQCKELIDQYHGMGSVGDFDISDEELKSAARQVYRCRRQHKFGGMFDFAKTSDKLDDISSTKWSQDPASGRFSIDFNNRTVGNSDSGLIDLK